MNRNGHYGPYGGSYVAETLAQPLDELASAYFEAREDPSFRREFEELLRDYVGRESPITVCRRLSAALGGATIALKREDLNHTGAHKVNNTIGQALLARRMGKKRLIAETGAGMHGVATATVAALFGLPCEVYMGALDVERQAPNVERMKMLGAKINAVTEGSATLKDAMNEALRDWVTNCDDTFYVIGTAAGPHPYPEMVKDFQSVIGREARRQCLEKFGRLPDQAIACVGGGSNAIGLFAGFMDDPSVRLVGVEASASRRAGAGSPRASTPPPSPAAGSASCTARRRCCCRPPTATSSTRIRSRPGSTTPASDRSTATSTTPAAPSTCRSATPRRWRRSTRSAATRG